MNQSFFWLLVWLLTSSAFAAKKPHCVTDTVTPDYATAVDLCLFHRYSEAELLLIKIIRQPTQPNREAARFLLLEEVYFWRGQYHSYVSFSDSTGQQPPNYAFAKLMIKRPALQVTLSTNEATIPFILKNKGHIIIDVLVHGKLRKFLVDTGAQRSGVSNQLANEIRLTRLLDLSIINSLGQALPSSISVLDSIQIGELHIANLPCFIQSLWGFGVDGVIGWDILKQFCFTIDYQAKALTFRQPVFKIIDVKNLLGGSRPLMSFLSQTGSQLNLFFDSGSNGKISFSTSSLAKIGSYKSGHALGFQLGFGGKIRFSRERTIKKTSLKIDEQTFNVAKALIQRANEVIGSIIIDGIVGSRQFKKGRLTIDYLNNHFDHHE